MSKDSRPSRRGRCSATVLVPTRLRAGPDVPTKVRRVVI